jgi:hypothetical protein
MASSRAMGSRLASRVSPSRAMSPCPAFRIMPQYTLGSAVCQAVSREFCPSQTAYFTGTSSKLIAPKSSISS